MNGDLLTWCLGSIQRETLVPTQWLRIIMGLADGVEAPLHTIPLHRRAFLEVEEEKCRNPRFHSQGANEEIAEFIFNIVPLSLLFSSQLSNFGAGSVMLDA